MISQRLTSFDGDVQLASMSRRATAFTIDELLRPDQQTSASQLRRVNFNIPRTKKIVSNITCNRTAQWPSQKDDDIADSSAASPTASSPCCSHQRVQCHLETERLWQAFNVLGLTEMIVTKSGRRMFPPLRVRLSGLDDDEDTNCCYDVILDVLPVDSRRYRYAYHRSSWVVSDRTAPDPTEMPCRADPTQSCRHPDGPFSASQLLQRVVSFDRVKLTNNRSINKSGYIVVDSMRKYCPRVRVVRRSNNVNGESCNSKQARCFPLSSCIFITVTAYQNQLMTKLKIDSNPFAKGFRDICRFSSLPLIRFCKGTNGRMVAGYKSLRAADGSTAAVGRDISHSNETPASTLTTASQNLS